MLGPITFLLLINDLPSHVNSPSRLFADDTSLIFTHPPTENITDLVNSEIVRLKQWADTWLVSLNTSKTKCLHVHSSRSSIVPSPVFDGDPIEVVQNHKHLGVVLNSSLTWGDHINYIIGKVSKRIGILRLLKSKLNRSSLRSIYITHIRSILEYCDVLWDGCTVGQALELEQLQNECLRIVTGLPRFCSTDKLLVESGFERLSDRRRHHRLTLLYKSLFRNECPPYFLALLPPLRSDSTARNNRNLNTFYLPPSRTATYSNSFIPKTLRDWNSLDTDVRCAPSISLFKRLIHPPLVPTAPIIESPRFVSIIYTKLKNECSSLNSHLHRVNLIPSPLCACGTGVEDNFHYFFNCPYYDVQRFRLMDELDYLGLSVFSIPTILSWNLHLDPNILFAIQSCVYKFILDTRRFC